MLEPAGLLWGQDARHAVAAGQALPLSGGPGAFSMIRHADRLIGLAQALETWPAAVRRLAHPVPDWAGLGTGPLVMGILNATPDSFSDGGDRLAPAAAIAAGMRMLEQGADVLDIGGESTRPGAAVVPPDEEQARILPVITALAKAGAVLSVDTRNATTMHRALEAGARIINDVSALTWDPAAAGVVARAGCPVILMHMRGTPVTMTGLTQYDDVARDVMTDLARGIGEAMRAGIALEGIAVDPGFGFAKTAAQSLELLQRLPLLAGLGRPILAGVSRKSMIAVLTGEKDAALRDTGSLAAALLCLARGARLLRVHDVPGTRQAVSVWNGM